MLVGQLHPGLDYRSHLRFAVFETTWLQPSSRLKLRSSDHGITFELDCPDITVSDYIHGESSPRCIFHNFHGILAARYEDPCLKSAEESWLSMLELFNATFTSRLKQCRPPHQLQQLVDPHATGPAESPNSYGPS